MRFLVLLFALPSFAADAVVSGHGGQCVTAAAPQVPEVAKGRQQAVLRACNDASVAFTIAPTGDVTMRGKCLVAGDPTLRAGSLLYIGDCGAPESAWVYENGRVRNRMQPAKVLSAFWSGNVVVADRVPGDPNQSYRLAEIVDRPAAEAFDAARNREPGAAIVRQGQRGVIVRGSVVELAPRRSLVVHR